MTTFTHQITYRLPADPVRQILEFSPTGKHIAIGDDIGREVRIVDCTERSSIVSCVATAGVPTSFVWDPVQAEKFIVGFTDGTFASFAIGKEEMRVDFLCRQGTITALALSDDALVLAVAVALDSVYVFRRKSFAGRRLSFLSSSDGWRTLNNLPDEFEFGAGAVSGDGMKASMGDAPPNPRSLCFSHSGTLFVSYERHGLM